MATKMTAELPAPTGLVAKYFGVAGGSNTYVYWVQAIYPTGKSNLAQSNTISSALGPDGNNRIQVEWNAMAGAIGYIVFRTTTTTQPSTTGFLATVTSINFNDQGSITPSAYIITRDGTFNAQARYDFAVDGGTIGTITLANSDTIPAGAIVIGQVCNSTTAFTGTGATVALGTSAGSSTTSLLGATAITSLTLDAVVALTPRTTPFKMTAAGTVTATIATANVTAGVLDILIQYILPVAL